MTSSSTFQPGTVRQGPSTGAAVAIALVAGVAVLTLVTVGITFFALAIAFPIVGPVVREFHLVVPASDLVTADRLAGFTWAFAAAGIASMAAGVGILVKSIQVLSRPSAD